MSLLLQLAQEASADESVISPVMFGVGFIGAILLMAYVRHLLKKHREP